MTLFFCSSDSVSGLVSKMWYEARQDLLRTSQEVWLSREYTFSGADRGFLANLRHSSP